MALAPWLGVRFSRHARNNLRLYKLDPAEAEAIVGHPGRIGRDRHGNPAYEGVIRGAVIRVVVALDEPDLIVTIYPRRK